MTMTPSSVAPVFADYQQRSTNLRSKILKNEEQRIQLEQRLRSLSSQSSRSYQRKQIQHIQSYFTRLNQDSQRAEQRNLQLLNDLSHAQQHLDRLHFDAEHLTNLKNDYQAYLEANYPNWQKPTSMRSSGNVASSNEFDRLVQHMKQNRHQLENDGNLRQSGPLVRQSYDVESSSLFRRYEDQLKIGLERTMSPSTPMINNENRDEQSLSESSDAPNVFARAKRAGSLRMELSRTGLSFLLDYLEKEFRDAIDKKKFYSLDSPTINQKRTILDIANERETLALEDIDATTVSMVILDQLPWTIRRTTAHQCLLTEDILSANIQDLDKDTIAHMLPEQDRSLWLRLVEHFVQLLRLHIMDSQTLANKFALKLVSPNAIYTHEKAKSLLKHIVDKLVRAQSASSEEEPSVRLRESIGQSNAPTSASWMKKLALGSAYDEDEDEDDASTSSSSTATNKSEALGRSPAITPRTKTRKNDDEDAAGEFFT